MVAQQVNEMPPAPTRPSGRTATKKQSRKPSAKVGGAGLGSAVSTLFWTLAAATFWKNSLSDVTLATLTGSSATILAFLFGYFVPGSD